MNTTADYLNQLEQDRSDLVDNLETKGITGLTGDETFTELVPEVLNISGGGDEYFSSLGAGNSSYYSGINKAIIALPSNLVVDGTNLSYAFTYCVNLVEAPLFDTSNVTNMNHMFNYCRKLTTVPLFDTSNVTDMNLMFTTCDKLTTVPQFDTSSVTNFSGMFSNCTELTTVPQFDTSSVTNFTNMFSNCSKLTNESLNNILGMCASATSFTGTKTLSTLGLYTYRYPVSRFTGLSNYQAFINAGWTIS